MPIVKAYNIIIIAINHINSNVQINPFDKKQPQLLYLKMDESLPEQTSTGQYKLGELRGRSVQI